MLLGPVVYLITYTLHVVHRFNKMWGQMFKASNQDSKFAKQVKMVYVVVQDR